LGAVAFAHAAGERSELQGIALAPAALAVVK